MKIKEMMELIQLHHPHIREVEARKLIQRISDQLCAETDILEATYYQNTTANKRYYSLDEKILNIKDVKVEGESIPRLIGGLNLEDDDTTGGNIDGS